MKVSILALALALSSPSTGAFTVPSHLVTASSKKTASFHQGLAAATLDRVEIETEVKEVPAAESTFTAEDEAKPIVVTTTTTTNVDETVKEEDTTAAVAALDPLNRVQVGRYNDRENSIALPFLKRPNKLDGSHAGDYGFDPLGLTETQDLYMMQEAELRHGRLAMLAVVGWPMSELVAPEWMLQQNGCAPSVLNGFSPLTFIATALFFGAAGFFEYKTSLRRVYDTELGQKHLNDMANVWKFGVAGDYNFDPLDLYSSIGDDALGRKGLRDVEISHGRSAMLGITAFAMWEFLTGHAIVENSMFFHPNLLLPALVAAFVGASSICEFADSDEYIQLKVSSEGEARLDSLKRSAAALDLDAVSEVALEKAGILAENAKIAFDKATVLAKELKQKYDEADQDYTSAVMKKIKE